MKVTNKSNLPQAFVNAVTPQKPPDGRTIRVTSLIEAPRIRRLEIDNWNDLEIDVEDNLWALFGSAVHEVLAQGSKNSFVLSETNLSVRRYGWVVQGTIDSVIVSEGLLQDYKTCKAYAIKFKSQYEKWEQQLNMYAYMLNQNEIKIEKIEIVAFLKDWDKKKALRDKDYPQKPVQMITMNLWSEDEQIDFMKKRLDLHYEAEINLPECNDEERWARLGKIAVMKKGRKSAVKLFDDKADALLFIGVSSDRQLLNIEDRPGEPYYRCSEGYCSVSGVCSQYISRGMKGYYEGTKEYYEGLK